MPLDLVRLPAVAAALLLAAACSTVLSAAMHEPNPGALTYLGGVVLPRGDGVGGLSGLVVTPDGTGFTAVSDVGRVVTGRLVHDEAGHLTEATDLTLTDLGGVPSGRKRRADAEALVRTADGWLVSFEGDHRILAYAAGGTYGAGGLAGRPRRLALPAAVRRLARHEGLEAVTALPDGRVLMIAEGQDEDGLHPAWIGSEGTGNDGIGRESGWRSFRYRSDAAYKPTDLAVLPGGDVLVLERHFSFLAGLKARLVRIAASDLPVGRDEAGEGGVGPVVEGFVLGDLAPGFGTDNFEGLSIRVVPDGTVHAYIVSDDNFSVLQRTLLVQYALRMAEPRGVRGR